MKPFLALAAAFCVMLGAQAGNPVATANYQTVPLPKSVNVSKAKGFNLSAGTVIAYPAGNEALKKNAEMMADFLAPILGGKPAVTDNVKAKNAIVLLANLKAENPEAYTIKVTSNGVTVNGASAAANFYGIQTLRKSLPADANGAVVMPAGEIKDEPRFKYRGAHLDVARHCFPLDSLKKFIDVIALHNCNRFHWHLTEDQGWRLESKKYPLLTKIGSVRSGTCMNHDFSTTDNKPYGGFYTQDEARELVKYAADRHITVIPEIDLPGHMLGALAAYPEMGCTGGPYTTWTRWGVSDDLLCGGNDKTYTFLGDILNEVADIFPSEYVHIGGDETPKNKWHDCPKCQAKIKELGLTDDKHSTKEQKLQTHVMSYASDALAKRGRKIIGWEEMMEGGLPEGATVMSWLGEASGLKAAQMGHDAVMTPVTYCYFDYYQSLDTKNEPDAIGGYLPVKKVYSYEPIPANFTPEEAAHIIGVQSNLWTEYIPTFQQALYMELPRLAALSEVQWTDGKHKDYNAFTRRLPRLLKHYDAMGANYAKHVFDVHGKLEAGSKKGSVKATYNTFDDAELHYTIDGTEPTIESPRYTGPLSLTHQGVVKIAAFRNGQRGAVITDSVRPSLSSACPVTFLTEPAERFRTSSPQTLADGVVDRLAFNNGNWAGWYAQPMTLVIDLGTPTKFSQVVAHSLYDTNSWIFPAESMTVSVSDDGKNFREVAAKDIPLIKKEGSGLLNFDLNFAPVTARYVKVNLACNMSMPEWHGGKGKPSFVFVDEITVN